MKITAVQKGSVADELKIKAGFEVLEFDAHKAEDILDYEYYNAQNYFTMLVKNNRGKCVLYDIQKQDGEDLGLEFEETFATAQCANNCIFCFVSQLPKGMRKTLYIRDDDYRHSFYYGNYITLTGRESEVGRIERLGLSPIYVSVHSTDDAVRRKLLQNPDAPQILPILKRLKAAGIEIHAQIVFCPGFNDDYVQTAKQLSEVCASLAIVPVGMTRHTKDIIKPVSCECAQKLIDDVHKLQDGFLKSMGTRFVFAADEFYLKAGCCIPDTNSYEEFCQMENGVGLLARFNNGVDYALNNFNGKGIDCSVATGEAAYPLISAAAQKVAQRTGKDVKVYKIVNDFFGHSVTVAGLVCGSDIIAQLKDKPLNGCLLIPRTMLKQFGDVFLDNVSVHELEKALNVKVIPVTPDGESFVKALLGATDE